MAAKFHPTPAQPSPFVHNVSGRIEVGRDEVATVVLGLVLVLVLVTLATLAWFSFLVRCLCVWLCFCLSGRSAISDRCRGRAPFSQDIPYRLLEIARTDDVYLWLVQTSL